ncbi:MAG: exonuclease SbcCD subunit D, partial [Oscillospiraceae bacterium]|nr:exonuclease SbcCD subunit D [Oscillospiraceae bacterium]
YDKPVPPAEATQLLDSFLTELSRRQIPAYLISGNHDSAERVAFGANLLTASGIYFSPVYQGHVSPIICRDSVGEVAIYLLPFVKPATARHALPEAKIESYTDAVFAAIAEMNPDPNRRNVLVAHQFVTGASRSGSEEVSVGGLDNVDAAVFAPFDYVALGHIHGAQCVGSQTVRYCGTPLQYAISELHQKKAALLVELREKGTVSVRALPLTPKRALRQLRGSYLELTARSFYQDFQMEDYFDVLLTDEQDVPDAMARLRTIYPNILHLDYDNTRTRAQGAVGQLPDARQQSPMELLAAFYAQQNGQAMLPAQAAYAQKRMEHIWEGSE